MYSHNARALAQSEREYKDHATGCPLPFICESVPSPSLSFDTNNMADESRVPSGSSGHQSTATVWKRKYLTLQKRCEQTEQVSLMI